MITLIELNFVKTLRFLCQFETENLKNDWKSRRLKFGRL